MKTLYKKLLKLGDKYITPIVCSKSVYMADGETTLQEAFENIDIESIPAGDVVVAQHGDWSPDDAQTALEYLYDHSSIKGRTTPNLINMNELVRGTSYYTITLPIDGTKTYVFIYEDSVDVSSPAFGKMNNTDLWHFTKHVVGNWVMHLVKMDDSVTSLTITIAGDLNWYPDSAANANKKFCLREFTGASSLRYEQFVAYEDLPTLASVDELDDGDFVPSALCHNPMCFAVVGDSITHAGWCNYITQYFPLSTLWKKGISGGTWESVTSAGLFTDLQAAFTTGVENWVGSAYTAPDFIFIELGQNGTFSGDPQTVWAKNEAELSPSASTVECIRYNLAILSRAYPNCKIVLISPYQNPSSEVQQQYTKGETLEECAKRQGIGFLDWRLCNIRRENETAGANGLYLSDGLHPNTNGCKYLSKLAAEYIKRNII